MPKQMFTCDKCKAPFDSEAEAISCEKKHKDFKVVRSYYGQTEPGIPYALTLRFDGGRESSYQFKPGCPDDKY